MTGILRMSRDLLPGCGELTGHQKAAQRSKLLRNFARGASRRTPDRILVASNRFPAVPENLRSGEHVVLVMLNKGIDDLRTAETPKLVELYELDVDQLAGMARAIRRHVSSQRNKVALPFDRDRCERNRGNVLTREGSIEEHVQCRLIVRADVVWE